jgi:hypothetical protein
MAGSREHSKTANTPGLSRLDSFPKGRYADIRARVLAHRPAFLRPMKLKIILITAVLAGLLAGCSTPDTNALRLGMTKEEAIRVMGNPDSVSAQGAYEYLNYTLQRYTGYGSMTRPYSVRLLAGRVESYGYMGQFPRVLKTFPPVNALGDSVQIESITPEPLIPGQQTDVTVKVKYTLRSLPQAMINLGFNVANEATVRSVNYHVVEKGSGEVEITGRVIPVDWGAQSPFRIMVGLGVYPHTPGSHALAVDQRDVALKR